MGCTLVFGWIALNLTLKSRRLTPHDVEIRGYELCRGLTGIKSNFMKIQEIYFPSFLVFVKPCESPAARLRPPY